MKTTITRLFVLGVSAFAYSGLQAQEAPVASGGEATGSGGSLTYSVGQVSYITSTASGLTYSEGVQQPYEILTLDVKESFEHITLNLFPNPTRENLNLNTGALNLSGVEYKVYDSQGRIILEDVVDQMETKISLGDNPPGNYFLNVMKDNQPVKSFKVIKN